MKYLSIKKIKSNPDNPRVIRDDKFEELKRSIEEFPKMLEIRPIVVNSDMMVLGGNMRLEACKDLEMDKVPVIFADNLTKEQEKEFIIKDNVSMGDWDWDALSDKENMWDREKLEREGLVLPVQQFYDTPDFDFEDDDDEEDDVPRGKSEMYVSVICPNCATEFDVKIS